jgi:23S rRNA (guanosine2251-2'-O)-methyltransferase
VVRRWAERSGPPAPPQPAGTEGLRLIAGIQPVREAVAAHKAALGRVTIEDRNNPKLEALLRFARDQGVQELTHASRVELDRWAGGAQHQGVLAWAPPLALLSEEDLLADPKLVAIALDGIQDPQNFGAVIRSAVAIGGAAIVWGEHASAPLTPATFRASAGAIEHARLCRVRALVGTLELAREQGVTVVGLDAHAPCLLKDLPLAGRLIVVVGSEHEGMGRAVRRACSVEARLASGRIDSLNASVAAAIALYQVSISLGISDG